MDVQPRMDEPGAEEQTPTSKYTRCVTTGGGGASSADRALSAGISAHKGSVTAARRLKDSARCITENDAEQREQRARRIRGGRAAISRAAPRCCISAHVTLSTILAAWKAPPEAEECSQRARERVHKQKPELAVLPSLTGRKSVNIAAQRDASVRVPE